MSTDELQPDFPVKTRKESIVIGKETYVAMSQSFSDKIFITLSSTGKIGQLLSISLASTSGVSDLQHEEMDMLPSCHLTPKFLLGSANTSRGEMAQLMAVQIGSLICTINLEERRTLLLGITLPGAETDWENIEDEEKKQFFTSMIELVAKTIKA